MIRTILVRPLWRLRAGTRYLVENPPPGYRLVVDRMSAGTLDRLAAYSVAYRLHYTINSVLPLNLIKAYVNRMVRNDAEADLVYSVLGVWFGTEPWILDLEAEQPHLMAGHELPADLLRTRVARILRAPGCRRIICWVDSVRQALFEWLGDDELIARKAEVVYWAVPPRRFVKEFNDRKVVLLFVDSAHMNTPLNFHIKGGKEVLEAFVHLRQRYQSLEMIVRSAVPKDIQKRYAGLPGLRIIDHVLSEQEMDLVWRSGDIFVQAAHATPGLAYIEAMSYELPVVTTDVFGNRFLVEDGHTGMLVPKPQVRAYAQGQRIPFASRRYRRSLLALDREVVEGLVNRLSFLIENPEVRRAMGRAARREVEVGRFSIQARNSRLKRILDEAVEGA